jgi:hypothetical protein
LRNSVAPRKELGQRRVRPRTMWRSKGLVTGRVNRTVGPSPGSGAKALSRARWALPACR